MLRIITALLTIFLSVSAYADAIQARLYTYASEYSQTRTVSELSFRYAAELAVRSSRELSEIKHERDEEAQQIDRALSGLMPVIRATASRNNLDRDRPDYREKAAQENLNAKIKLRQILFSDSILASRDSAEYKTTMHRLIAESVRLDVIKETADVYYTRIFYTGLEQTAEKALKRMNSIKDILKKNKAPKSSMKLYADEIRRVENLLTLSRSEKIKAQDRLSAMTGLTIGAGCAFRNYSEMTGHATLNTLKKIFSTVTDTLEREKLLKFLTDKSLDDSAELKAVDELIKLNKRDIQAEKRKFSLPDVSFSGEYTQYLDKDSDTSEYSADLSKNDWSVNLRLSMPVFDGKKSTPNIYAKNTELLQYFSKRAEVKEAVKTRMENAVISAGYAGTALSGSKELAASAAEKYDKNLSLYKLKKIRSAVLINSAAALNTAQEAVVRAEYEMINSLTDIQRAYGKFFALNEDYEDTRFLLDLQQSIGSQMP